jgi:hypothetical protein
MKRLALVVLLLVVASITPRAAGPKRLLFIGNSFTFGELSPVHFWRSASVTDLNDEGIGGVPALVKAMTVQAGLDYDVSLETHPGVGLDWHLANRLDVLTKQPYDVVVMHGFSTLDAAKPGDPAKLVDTATQMADALRKVNPNVQIHLTSTWSRADQTYPQGRPWFGKSIETMGMDVRAGYDKAAAAMHAASVIPVGEAWNRAIKNGVADPNPYDGLDAGKIDLWAIDHYHASAQGYYLEALMVFGDLTGIDPRSLGAGECSAYELGFTGAPARALQQIAFDELDAAHRTMTKGAPLAARATRCK